MTYVRVKGFKIFKDRHQKWRCYHRATNTPVDLKRAPLGTVEFFAECQRIVALSEKVESAKPGTLGFLIVRYKSHSAFLDLAPRTRADYQKCFDYLKPIADTPLTQFSSPLIVKIRDKAATAKGRRFGNYVKSVFSLLFVWGKERGYVKTNPAEGIKGLKKPKGAPEANRPWSDYERHNVLAALPDHMLLPISLMMFCGLDPQDALRLRRTAIKSGNIDARRGKTNVPIFIPLPEPVLRALQSQPDHPAITLCANSRGKPWTVSGFRASWRPIRIKLEKDNQIQPGLTLKGLRHTVATILREMGKSYGEIAEMLGQKTEAMAKHYSRRADRTRNMTATIKDFDAELNKRSTKSVKPH